MLPKSLDPDALRQIAAFIIIILVIVAGLVLWVVQKMVMKVVVLGFLIGIGVFVWYQRDALQDCGPPNCSCKVLKWHVEPSKIPGCELTAPQ
jgi:hypothetical protein